MLACSSAGGGLRIAVVGNEELVTAEAGRRVALSSGGKVVARARGGCPGRGVPRPAAHDPARRGAAGRRHRRRQRGRGPARRATALAASGGAGRWWSRATSTRGPRSRLLLGDRDAGRPRRQRGARASACSRRSPRARAIREMFLRHVIGGKHLRAADAGLHRDGARRDARRGADRRRAARRAETGGRSRRRGGRRRRRHHRRALGGRGSIPRTPGSSREVVATTPVTRTVEGDLGMRWSALSTWEAGVAAGLAARTCDRPPPLRRTAEPAFLPATDAERDARRRADRRGGGRPSRCAATSGRSQRGLRPRRPGRRAQRQGPARGRPARGLGRRAAAREPRRGCAGARCADGSVARGLAAAGAPEDRGRPRLRARGRRPAGGGRPAAAAALARSLSTCDETPRQADRQDYRTSLRSRRAAAGRERELRRAARAVRERSGPRCAPTRRATERAARRSPAASRTSRAAQVPYGVDLAAAWSWRFLVISIAGLAVLWLLQFFLVVVLPLVIALLHRRAGRARRRPG